MRNNKKLIFALIAVVVLVGVLWLQGKKGSQSASSQQPPKGSHSAEGSQSGKKQAAEAKAETDIEYWTCSMHPQVKNDKPGKCPICGMDLIPIHAGDKGKITIDERNREYLGVRSVPAERRHLVKRIRLAGKVVHDFELYRLQQEYLNVYTSLQRYADTVSSEVTDRQEALLETAALRLRLMGLRKEEIKELEQRGTPDRSLIDPAAAKGWIQADVYEQDLGAVKAGQNVRVKLKGSDQEVSGRVYAIEDVLNPQTRSASARIVVDGTTHLRHEVFADVTLEVDLGHDAVSVPVSSVIDTGTRKVAYVDTGEGRYELRQIKTGVEADGFVQVTEGVKEGELVVTDGNFLLDSQSTLTGGQSVLYSGSEKIDESSQQPIHRH